MIGKIQRVPLREVWRHEALDFTSWLTENTDVLSEILDIELANAERERAAGDFSVDILAEDDAGNPVIIENQLEKSDHDHLGKIITYLTAYNAKTAVWIVAEPRPEHVRAVSWLNESTDASFYLLKMEAIRIGDSAAAPLLTVIVGPSEEAKEVGERKRDLAERHLIRRQFWADFLAFAKTKTKLHATISPSYETWVGTGAGRMGLAYNYVVNQHETRAELYIDRGKDSDTENKRIFDQLEAHTQEIEEAFGGSLTWERLEGKRACRISKRLNIGGYRDEERLPEIFEAAVDAMIRLERALGPFIRNLTF
jgi:hypothetical protein